MVTSDVATVQVNARSRELLSPNTELREFEIRLGTSLKTIVSEVRGSATGQDALNNDTFDKTHL